MFVNGGGVTLSHGAAGALVAIATVLVLVSSPAAPASAHYDSGHTWTNCYTARTTIYTSYDSSAAFPADGWGGGVKNSFYDRLVDAVGTANIALNNAGVSNRLEWWGASAPRLDIVFEYGVAGAGVARTIRTRENGTVCDVHSGSTTRILSANIEYDSYAHWFTQDNSRRAYWENHCYGPRGDGTGDSYTCSKDRDFGGVSVHELLHALGLRHPYHVDDHTGHPVGTFDGDAMNAARCESHPSHDGFAAASACTWSYVYRTTKRTIDSYDIDSLRKTYDNNT